MDMKKEQMKTQYVLLLLVGAILFTGYFEEVPGTEGQRHCYKSIETLIKCFAQ